MSGKTPESAPLPVPGLVPSASIPAMTLPTSFDGIDYIDLGSNYNSDWNVWSNRLEDMQISAYFSSNPETPSIGTTFHLPALKPVLVKPDPDIGKTYLIADSEGSFYLWNETNTEMWKFNDESLVLSDAVNLVSTNTYSSSDLVQQFERGIKAWTDHRDEDAPTSTEDN